MNERASEIRVGKFTIIRRLGRGGMGAVYEAHDPALDRRVAIKTLTNEAIADPESRSRFEREAKAAAKLAHKNIVTVYELCNFGGAEKPYIVMEYLAGTDVASIIEKGGLAIAEALDITIQLLEALDFAHQNGVVHRDIKPSNLRHLDTGQIKIMDFGIARVEGSHQITKSGVMIGTVHYMSPEQVRGQKPDGRTDIFSAGCILYELLTGERPFKGETATAILYSIVHETPERVVESNPNVPQELQDVLDRALAKDADDRFQTAGEMARELSKILAIYKKTFPRTSDAVQKDLDEIAALSRERKWAEIVPRAKTLVERFPQLDDARRHLRRAMRALHEQEEEERRGPEERTRQLREIHSELTELFGPDSPTFQGAVAPTEMFAGSDTRMVMGDEPPPDGPTSPKREGTDAVRALVAPMWALVVVVLLGLGGVAAWSFLKPPPAPVTVSHRVRIASEPPGAGIFLDGVATGVSTTEGGIELVLSGDYEATRVIELRLDGYEPASKDVVLREQAPDPIALELVRQMFAMELTTVPAGAAVAVDGESLDSTTPLTLELTEGEHEIVLTLAEHEARTVVVTAGEDLGGPIELTPLGRPGTLRIGADYPVTIHMGGRAVSASSTEPRVELRPGTYRIQLIANDVFLNRFLDVSVRESDTTFASAPALGRVNINATPGNCTVIIDGVDAGAPPLRNRNIVEGSHEVVFAWPDGVRDVQTVVVEADTPAFVTGQRP